MVKIAYSTAANIRAQTGLTTTNISDADLTTIIALADKRIDQFPGVSLNDNKKALASEALSSCIAFENLAGALSMSQMEYSIVGTVRLSKRDMGMLRSSQARTFYARFLEIMSENPDSGLVSKVNG